MPTTKSKAKPKPKPNPTRIRKSKVPAPTGPDPGPGQGKETVLVLRTCNADMTSSHHFTWPESGPVAAKDWQPTFECGHGLHGFLWGEGDGALAEWSSDAKWLVVEVERIVIVDLKGKVKFPRGNVVHCGDRFSATTYLAADPRAYGRAIVGGTATAGDRGTATAGYRGTATAGDSGTATAGYGGTATAGYGGTATAGDRGTLVLRRWDRACERWRLSVAYVGEAGIQANQPYRLDELGSFAAAKE